MLHGYGFDNHQLGMTNPNEFVRHLHSIDLNCESAYDLIITKAAVIHRDGFPIPYPHEFPSTSMDKVSDTLVDMFNKVSTSETDRP